MENASKALTMAGAILISVIIIGMLVYAYRNWGSLAQSSQESEATQEVIDFNQQYEAYNKQIMYGVDVISCINKAINNNEKYEKNGKYAINTADGSGALIQVKVKLNKVLTEEISMTYVDTTNKKNKEKKLYQSNIDEWDKSYQNIFYNSSVATVLKLTPKEEYTNIQQSTTLGDVIKGNGTWSSDLTGKINGEGVSDGGKEMSLLNVNNSNYERFSLSDTSGKSVQDIKNSSLYYLTTNSTKNGTITVKNNQNGKGEGIYSLNSSYWSTITWTSAFSDFKKRKFECTAITRNESSGLVSYLEFTEK